MGFCVIDTLVPLFIHIAIYSGDFEHVEYGANQMQNGHDEMFGLIPHFEHSSHRNSKMCKWKCFFNII